MMNRLCRISLKLHLVTAAVLVCLAAGAQDSFTSRLQFVDTPPPFILSTRAVALFDHAFTQAELEEVQKAFQQIGIDAVAYFETDVVLSGKDVILAFSNYFSTRQIKYLIFLEKRAEGFRFIATEYLTKPPIYDPTQGAWRVSGKTVNEMLRTVFQDSWRSQKKKNFLINEYPEKDIIINPIPGKRQEFYAIDLKIDNLAVEKFGDPAMDQQLEEFFKANYPLKYKMIEHNADERELNTKGFQYILCWVHTRGDAAREILGYDMSKAGSAYASITFPNGQLQLKTIPEETVVYKFYFRHLYNGNAYLGTKWDADVNWLDALRNHILAFKSELKIN